MTSYSIPEIVEADSVAAGLRQLASAMSSEISHSGPGSSTTADFNFAAGYLTVTETSPVGIWQLAQPSGMTIHVNQAMCALLEVDNEAELAGKSYQAFFTPETIARVDAEKSRGAAGQTSVYEAELIGAKGGRRKVIVSGVPVFSVDGRIVSSIGAFTEIIGEKETQHALRKTENRYRELLENANDIIFRVDMQGNFISMNPAAQRITGYLPGEIQSIGQIVAPEHRELVGKMRSAKLAGSKTTTYELAILARDGRRVYLELNTSLSHEDGEACEILGIGRDITWRKAAEQFETGRREVLEMAAQNRPLEVMLRRLTALIEGQFSGAICCILLAKGAALHVESAPSLPYELRAVLEGLAIDPESLSCATAAHSGTPVITPEISACPNWWRAHDIARNHQLGACWSFPIISSAGDVLGTLAVYHAASCRPVVDEEKLLESGAHLAAIAIEHRQLTDALAHQSQHDKLTGLPNRLLFEDRLNFAISRARRADAALALLYIDIDRFKLINDTLGLGIGDSVLQEIADRLKEGLRETDTLARVGGDEFILLLAELDNPDQAARVSAKIFECFQKPFGGDSSELFVTPSIGISVFPRDGEDAVTLQRNADAAMFRAKGLGKNNCQFFTPRMTEASARRLEVRNQLHRALERSELSLFYQPQLDLRSGKLVGLEALLRWNNAVLGPVSPGEFISVAEDCGLIVPIGDWVLRRACFQNRLWQKLGYDPVKVAVNVSAIQFAQSDFVDSVAAALQWCSLDPRYLELELTESVVMSDHVECSRRLERLRALGVLCSIDDFGTGYSSLQYLQKLPIHSLKIDLSFVRDIRIGEPTPPLIEAITGLAHGMQLFVVAEGVEKPHQLQALRDVGCDQAQGYLLGHPVAVDEVQDLLASIRQTVG